MSDNFTLETLDSDTNLNWDLDQMLASLTETDWWYVYYYQNNSYICDLEKFPYQHDQLYYYILTLQESYRQRSNLTTAQTIFVNSTILKHNMKLYKTHTVTESIPIYNNLQKYTIIIGLRNSIKYIQEYAPTFPTNVSILSDNIVAENFDNYPIESKTVEDNKTYISNRSIPIRGKELPNMPMERYLAVFYLEQPST